MYRTTYPGGMSGPYRNQQAPANSDGGSGMDRRRRSLVSHLREVESCQLVALAHEVARRETGTGSRTVSQDHIRNVYLDLQRNHVPALVETGLLSYAEDVGTVTLCDDESSTDGESA